MPTPSKLRWTISAGATEFRTSRKAMAKRLANAGVVPGPDGKFSTREISAAAYGDMHGEQLRKTKEEADKLALANEKERGRLVERSAVEAALEGVYVASRQKILASPLLEEEKDEIIAELARMKTALGS